MPRESRRMQDEGGTLQAGDAGPVFDLDGRAFFVQRHEGIIAGIVRRVPLPPGRFDVGGDGLGFRDFEELGDGVPLGDTLDLDLVDRAGFPVPGLLKSYCLNELEHHAWLDVG